MEETIMQRVIRQTSAMLATISVVAMLAILTSCSADQLTGGKGKTPSLIYWPKGNTATGTAGAPLPDSVVVLVADKKNLPVPGVTVSFSVTSGGGSVTDGVRGGAAPKPLPPEGGGRPGRL
jgi:hypothetical protein